MGRDRWGPQAQRRGEQPLPRGEQPRQQPRPTPTMDVEESTPEPQQPLEEPSATQISTVAASAQPASVIQAALRGLVSRRDTASLVAAASVAAAVEEAAQADEDKWEQIALDREVSDRKMLN